MPPTLSLQSPLELLRPRTGSVFRVMDKRDRVIRLLETYGEVVGISTGDVIGDGDGLPGMPPAYREGSYRELERCLALLAAERPKQHRQVRAAYLDCQYALRDVRARIQGPQGKLIWMSQRRRVAAKACPGCGRRVTLEHRSMSRAIPRVEVWHVDCLPWTVRVVVEAA